VVSTAAKSPIDLMNAPRGRPSVEHYKGMLRKQVWRARYSAALPAAFFSGGDTRSRIIKFAAKMPLERRTRLTLSILTAEP